MRSSFAIAVVLFASLLLPSAARSQEPFPASTSLQAPPCVYPPRPAPPALTCYQPDIPCDRKELFAVELMLGQELGVRGQIAVFGDNREAVVIEGFYGELFDTLSSSQALGAGARYLLRTGLLDCASSLEFGPGLDMFFHLDHNGLILLAPSIDVEWLDKLGEGFEWEFGLDASLGIGIAGRTHHGNSG